MKLSDWARKHNLSYPTAYSLFKRGQLPVKHIQLDSGTILILEDEPIDKKEDLKTYIYARVSSFNKKDDLDRQAKRCEEFCFNNGWPITKTVKEIASGTNDKRQKLFSLIDKTPKRIVVEHKDRLTRFGFNYFEKILSLLNYELIVINRETCEENDLMKDVMSVMTSFCCRLYGLRKGKNKSKQIKQMILE